MLHSTDQISLWIISNPHILLSYLFLTSVKDNLLCQHAQTPKLKQAPDVHPQPSPLADLHPLSHHKSIHNSTFCHPTSTHSTPNTQQTLNTPPHPAPIRPGAGGGSGARVQTEVNRKWLFSPAPRS